jgi:hypothetical protein
VHVLMNNCWHGFAVRNARTVAQLLAQTLADTTGNGQAMVPASRLSCSGGGRRS